VVPAYVEAVALPNRDEVVSSESEVDERPDGSIERDSEPDMKTEALFNEAIVPDDWKDDWKDVAMDVELEAGVGAADRDAGVMLLPGMLVGAGDGVT
tara:strand:- start:34694 stop:34984 length:291 start_codon:yes stop_codon:yes gene_type:complete